MKRNKLLIKAFAPVLFFFPLLAFTSYAYSTNYYVDGSNGNDSYNGQYETFQGGLDGPWKTIGKAASTVPSGSHTVNVAAGTYAERVTITTNGTDSNNMLHYKANGTVVCRGFQVEGNYVEVEGFTCASPFCDWAKGVGVRIMGKYCTVLNNICQDCYAPGITLESTANNCAVKGNTIVRCGVNGLAIYGGSNHLIENNDISDIRARIGNCFLAEEANGVEFHGFGHTFRGNYIHDIVFANQSGYHPHIDAFQTYGGNTHDVIFECNHIFMGNSTTGTLEDMQQPTPGNYCSVTGWMLEDAYNITIRNNVIEAWGGVKSQVGSNSNFYIYNNTWRCDWAVRSGSNAALDISGISNLYIYNNITIDFDVHYRLFGSGLAYDYNLMWNSNGHTPSLTGYTPAAHDKKGINPMVLTYPPLTPIVWGPSGYQLQSSSPAKDAGTTIATVTNDYDGVSRPQGGAYDIGAYEYEPKISRPMGLRIVN
jgi:hypothetical protein